MRTDEIFLWFALVIRRLRNLIEDEVSFQRLNDEIDQPPQKLNRLFNHTFESTRPLNKTLAYRTFAILTRLEEWRLKFPLISHNLADQCDGKTKDEDIPILSGV